MEFAINLLEIELIKQESELDDNIRLRKSCDESAKKIFAGGVKENRSNIRALKKAINILKL